MLFMEEHAEAVRAGAAGAARAMRRDARLHVGAGDRQAHPRRPLRHDGAKRGAFDFLKKLRGGKGANDTGGAAQLAMLRRIPKILRFIPGPAQDLRAYFLTLQYWLAGSDDNVANLVRFLVNRYAERRARASARRACEPSRRSNIPTSASTIRACPGASQPRPKALPRADGPARRRRPVADALLHPGQQHRALRRGDRGAGGARASASSRSSPAVSTRGRRRRAFFFDAAGARASTPSSR